MSGLLCFLHDGLWIDRSTKLDQHQYRILGRLDGGRSVHINAKANLRVAFLE